MNTRSRLILSLVAVAGLACSICGPVLPDQTTRTVTPADMAGTYTYEYMGKTATVTLNADGTFEITGSDELSGSGTWHLDGDEITLRYLEPPDERKSISGWYVYDTEDGGFAIMGGEGDPDLWNGLWKTP